MDLGAGGAMFRPSLEVKLVEFAALLYAVPHEEGISLSLLPRLICKKEGICMKNQNFTRSSRWDLRRVTTCAVLIAMSIVFSRALSISTDFLRFNLGSLPVVLAAVLFGPGAGFAVGAVADIIGGILAGYAINPLITLGAACIGFFAGLVWQYLPARSESLRLGLGILLGHVIGSIIINSLALRLFYHYDWSVLAARIPNALALSAAEFVLMRALLANHALTDAIRGGFTGRKAS